MSITTLCLHYVNISKIRLTSSLLEKMFGGLKSRSDFMGPIYLLPFFWPYHQRMLFPDNAAIEDSSQTDFIPNNPRSWMGHRWTAVLAVSLGRTVRDIWCQFGGRSTQGSRTLFRKFRGCSICPRMVGGWCQSSGQDWLKMWSLIAALLQVRVWCTVWRVLARNDVHCS